MNNAGHLPEDTATGVTPPEVETEVGEGEGELADDPRIDPEALCLCALLWAPTATAARVCGVLVAADFYSPVYAELYELIADAVGQGRPHDPASIATTITAHGLGPDHHGVRLRRALADATAAGAGPETAAHYALAVARTAYRRGYATAATALTQAAAELGEHELFDHLLGVGRTQRAAHQRLEQLRTTLGPGTG